MRVDRERVYHKYSKKLNVGTSIDNEVCKVTPRLFNEFVASIVICPRFSPETTTFARFFDFGRVYFNEQSNWITQEKIK